MRHPRWPRLAAAAVGFVWFLQVCGASTLDPWNTTWLFSGDWRQHWLGFLFFQRGPWTWPLGEVPSLLYPVGTNIGFTDSNPLLSILVKPFAGVLPAEYQLIGLWLASCFVMQGYMGAALTSAVTKDPVEQALGGYFFVLSPVLFARIAHDTLCAQWILLALLYLGLRDPADGRRDARAPGLVTLAVMFAAAVHPYLAAMSWALAQGVLMRLWRARRMKAWLTLVWMAISTAAMLAVWGAIGYFRGAADGSSGFGEFSADFLTLFDPIDYSRLVPPLPSTSIPREGLGFLGVGGMIALAAAIVVAIRRRPRLPSGVIAIATICGLMAIYSLSSSIRFGGTEILNIEALYAPVLPLFEPFRSSGRFIWPLHYLVLTLGLWGVTRLFDQARSSLGTLLLGTVVVIQGADVRLERWWPKERPETHIAVATFELARGHYRHLALAPQQVFGACHETYDEDYVYRFMLLAYRLNMTFNSGTYARLDSTAARSACAMQNQSIDSGALDPQTIYVASAIEIERFKASGKAACGRWDGYWYCVGRESNPRFATFIETGKDPGRTP